MLKAKNPESTAVGKIRIEAENNAKLNAIGVGPKFIFYNPEKDFLVREFVEGIPLLEWIKNKNGKQVFEVLEDVFWKCFRMDSIKMNKYEMTNPHKDILVSHDKAFIIDFERCRFVERPKNVTQFCQFLAKGKMSSALENIGVSIGKEELLLLAEKYKSSYSEKDFLSILSYLEELFG